MRCNLLGGLQAVFPIAPRNAFANTNDYEFAAVRAVWFVGPRFRGRRGNRSAYWMGWIGHGFGCSECLGEVASRSADGIYSVTGTVLLARSIALG